jgi:hypothetical protein
MKTILSYGIGTTLFMYIMFSFGSHSWDPMTWNWNSNYWFGCLSGLGWFTGILVHWTGLDKDQEF